MLAVTRRNARSLVAAVLLVATHAQAASHCAPGETNWFSCALAADGRVISLCGGDAVGADAAWLQFRAGPPGAPDLVFPAAKSGSRALFAGEHLVRDGAPVDSVWFKAGRVGYGMQARNPAPAFHGLWVMRGRVTQELRCAALPDGWDAGGAGRFSTLVRSLAR